MLLWWFNVWMSKGCMAVGTLLPCLGLSLGLQDVHLLRCHPPPTGTLGALLPSSSQPKVPPPNCQTASLVADTSASLRISVPNQEEKAQRQNVFGVPLGAGRPWMFQAPWSTWLPGNYSSPQGPLHPGCFLGWGVRTGILDAG